MSEVAPLPEEVTRTPNFSQGMQLRSAVIGARLTSPERAAGVSGLNPTERDQYSEELEEYLRRREIEVREKAERARVSQEARAAEDLAVVPEPPSQREGLVERRINPPLIAADGTPVEPRNWLRIPRRNQRPNGETFADDTVLTEPPEDNRIQYAQARNNPNDGPHEERRGDQWNPSNMINRSPLPDSGASTEPPTEPETQPQPRERLFSRLRGRLRNVFRRGGTTREAAQPAPTPEAVEIPRIETDVAVLSERGAVRTNNQDSVFTISKGFHFGEIKGTRSYENSEALARILTDMGLKSEPDENFDILMRKNERRIYLAMTSLENLRAYGRLDGLEILADGMGSHSRGEIISSLATYAIADQISLEINDDNEISVGMARRAIERAQALVHEYNDLNQQDGGTTLAFTLRHKNKTIAASIGDSRIYKQDQRGLVKLETTDHTLKYATLAAGVTLPSQYLEGQNPLTASIGSEPLKNTQADVVDLGPLKPGEKVFIVCDGVYGDIQGLNDANRRPEAIQTILKRIDEAFKKNGNELHANGTQAQRDRIELARLEAAKDAFGMIFKELNLQGLDPAASADAIVEHLTRNNGEFSRDNISAIVINAIGEGQPRIEYPLDAYTTQSHVSEEFSYDDHRNLNLGEPTIKRQIRPLPPPPIELSP